MAKKTVIKKKAAASNPDSIPEGGYKVQSATAKRRPLKKTGGEELPSISIHEKVALLAYRFWEERGKQEGSAEDDWYRAEKEVLADVFQKNSR